MPRHHNISPWTHDHLFASTDRHRERATWRVVVITVVMMVVEIAAGWHFNSMALLADGWHMSTHALALGIAAVAYRLARRYAADDRFAFGTWKIEVLGAHASALILAMIALLMAGESVRRLVHPLTIGYNQALLVAAIGLVVNVVCAVILTPRQAAPHEHAPHPADPPLGHDRHAHGHRHGTGDINLRAARVHVITDALTSVFAIVALLGGKFMAWGWLDPAMGIVGAAVILVWAAGLIKDTAVILLDLGADPALLRHIREKLEADGDARVADIHLWRVGQSHFACIVSLVAESPKPTAEYRQKLEHHPEIKHLTVEVHRYCPPETCAP